MIIIFAKKDVYVHKIWAETVHEKIGYNGEVYFTNNIIDLQTIMAEYTTNDLQEPVLLIIGKFLFMEKDGQTCMTNFLVKQGRLRKKCIVFTLTTESMKLDVDKLQFPELDFTNFYEIYGELLANKNFQKLVFYKDIATIKEMIKKIRKDNVQNSFTG